MEDNEAPGVAEDTLSGHPDRDRWNARHQARAVTFSPHPLAQRALSLDLPAGPVADLACGASGSALLAAARGRRVTAVDVSDAALRLLSEEARRRGLADLITLVHADLAAWRPAPAGYALVLCFGFWDSGVFAKAATAVRVGGLLAWEAFTDQARLVRPGLPAEWRLAPEEPASLLPEGYGELEVREIRDEERGAKRGLLARRMRSA